MAPDLGSGLAVICPENRAGWIAGFVAAEGTFTSTGGIFAFAVALGALDAPLCHLFRYFFGVGHVCYSPRRKQHFGDEVRYSGRSKPDLINVILPFMDEHLPPSYKRRQYLEWRERLLDYWEFKAKRARECTEPDCTTVRRAHGLCRHHLNKAGLG